jgi:putative transposase
LNCYGQQSQLPEVKKGLPEYNNVHSQVLQSVVKRVDTSFQNFFRRVKQGVRKEELGYPKFKSFRRYNSITYPQSGFTLKDDTITLSKIGTVKIILHRPIPANAIVKTLTIRKDKVGDWFACFSVDMIEKTPRKVPINKTIGVDVGIEKLATLSNGIYFENPKHIKKLEHKLKLVDRQLSRKNKGSMNRKKAILIRAKVYRKLERQRGDYFHKIAKYLVDNFDMIAFEDLNIKDMVQNNYLSKSIMDTAWNKLFQFTTYKAEEQGKKVILVDSKNTSQECSGCGTVVWKSLSVRTHKCHQCLLVLDRDLNAAINIKNRALQELGQVLPEVTPVEIGVQQLENVSPLLSRSLRREAISSTPEVLGYV